MEDKYNWKNFYTSVKISDSNEPIWMPQIPTKFKDKLKLLWYRKFGQYKENETTKWFEYKSKKIIIANTFNKILEDAKQNIHDELCRDLFGG